MLSCSLIDNDVKFNLFRLFYVIIAIYYFLYTHTLNTTKQVNAERFHKRYKIQ